MQIDVITLFPGMFKSPFEESIVARALKNGIVTLRFHNLRNWAIDSYGTVDDKPFGGGAGMVLMIEPIDKAISDIKKKYWQGEKGLVVAMSAKGETYKQEIAENLHKEKNIIILCGHYEGFDQRILDNLVDMVISIGDYILTGGELASMILIDSIVRLLPGVLGKDESSLNDSYSISIGRHKQFGRYTRPQDYKGWKVPTELISGDQKKIAKWEKDNLK